MNQMNSKRIVNVASVPQRSPFRYPGGKTWLVPFIRTWLRSLSQKPAVFVEPFAGGGIVSLTVAFENLAERLVMVELDQDISAVWHTILGSDAKWLGQRIMDFDLTVESAKAALADDSDVIRDRAFRTILKNRVYHGGIMAAGSAMIRHGENGKGIKSRWYPSTLRRRIEDIIGVQHRIEFIEGDGLPVLERFAGQESVCAFIDPPYTAAGKKAGSRLYKHNELDHERLFKLTASLNGNFLMTYDNADGVKDLALRHGFDTEVIAMKNTHHAKMTELLIGRDLSWARRSASTTTQQLLFE